MDFSRLTAHQSATPQLTHHVQADEAQRLTAAANDHDNADTNTIAGGPNVGIVVARIENILSQIIDSVSACQELSIAFTPRRPARSRGQPDEVRFPGRNQQEAVKFARILLILQLSHDALVSGTILTKRHIFYQHQDLFERQTQVDDLVDDIAFTLGIGRADLNIVAASKGVLAGPLTLHLTDGTSLDPCSGDLGVAIPAIQSVSAVHLHHVKWFLVVEKDAIFRSLCSSQFWRDSLFGPGVLVTAKGYPDLTTRSFLNYISTRHPQLPILALVDYDPDGVRILRCYRHGSDRLSHEADLDTQAIRWLGIKSDQLIQECADANSLDPRLFYQSSQSSQVSITSTACREPISYMGLRERGVAVSALKKLGSFSSSDTETLEMRRELQVMIALGVKAEIEWLDESGDLCQWLDNEIGTALSLSPTL
ncbi:TP6A-N domain-containing protein [Fusarium sp. Ph1]|nr:TP6A-N domain-containing protein [Fusarium sp. Ph1]